ncbi:MAG TPA: hypothetical protein VLA37_13835 [Sphingomonadaceae bacterium]|nr:hypothetical protein [Sphingomonadaceae bacterium]
MRNWLAIASAIAVTACGSGTDDASAPSPAASEAPPVAPIASPQRPAPTTLAGEWRVAGIDGADFNEPYGLGLSADAGRLWFAPECAGYVRAYRIAGSRITLTDPTPDAAICEIGLPPRVEELFAALDAADTVAITPSNGIEISGHGRSVLLFSQ